MEGLIGIMSIIDKMINGEVNFNDSKIATAYALNLCTVSVSQIIDYDDVVVLEQEYETILNNLNIERMPKDEALLKILKQLLDTITFFRIQEGDKKFIDKEYQNKMKNAIWNAVPNFGLIVAGGNPITMSVSLASQVGIGYMNYRKNKAENAFEHEKEMWQLQRAAIEQFNGLRRELFDTAWRLVDAHELPDEYRLTERQVKQYNEILMDPDAFRRYERLDTIKENFIAYPPFWYFFGHAANELSRLTSGEISLHYLEYAKVYYEIFVRSFSACNLLRENQIASSCALEYIDLLRIDVPHEREKISELLKFALKMSGNANDVLQLCSFAYLKIGDTTNAANLFRRLVNEDYNTIVNAQLLSGYYVNMFLAGDRKAQIGYNYLRERIDEAYLYPFPDSKLITSGEEKAITSVQNNFISNQKQILVEKFGLVISQFREKYRIAFNRCIPVPSNKKYTDLYFNGSADAFAARKADGVLLRNRRCMGDFIADIQDCDFPYNYLIVLNDMLNAISTLNCIQGYEGQLTTSVGNAIIERKEQLNKLRDKIDDPVKFNIDTYNQLIEISFDDFTREFFDMFAEYAGKYIELRNDIVSMNEAELNLREFCIKQNIDTPEVLYETANDVAEEIPAKKQYLGIELIDEGVLTSVANDTFAERMAKILPYANSLCIAEDECQMIISGCEEFDRYFIRLGIPNKTEIRRKTIAILDDHTSKDKDLLFTTDGIMQIVRGKTKEVVYYDDVCLNSTKTAIVLHQSYSNENVNMSNLIEMILSLRSKPFAEVKGKKSPIDLIAGIIKK